MKKLKQILFIMVITLITFINAENVNAATLSGVSPEPNKLYEFKWYNGINTPDYGNFLNYTINDNGISKVGYCIEAYVTEGFEPNLYAKGTFDNTNLPNAIRQKLALIAYYGYDYPSHNTQNFRSATQALLWETILNEEFGNNYKVTYIIYPFDEDGYFDYDNITEQNITNEKNIILDLVNNHDKKPSFHGQVIDLKLGDSITLTDKNNVLQNYIINNENGITVDGNKLTLTTNNLGTNELKFTKKQVYDRDYAIYYAKDYQKIITAGNVEDVYFNLTINSLVPIKVNNINSETNKNIKKENISFKIYDTQAEKYLTQTINGTETEIFKTDENGSFTTPALKKGKYILKQVDKAPHGYTVSNKELEFEVNDDFISNNQIQVNFKNKPAKGKIEITKTGEKINFSNNTLVYEDVYLENIKFGLYAKENIHDSHGNLVYLKNEKVAELITDKNGYVKIENLLLGEYYIKELETKDGYILDSKNYNFNLTYKDELTELINHQISFKNNLEKNSLSITILNNSNKPLSNKLIEIYTNEANPKLVFCGITDNNGKLLFSLPQGKYFIKEKQVFENQKHHIIINNNKKLLFISKKENEDIEVPNTGLEETNNFPSIYLLLILSIIIFNILLKRKEVA